jgi:hypothetical protein
VNYAHAVLPSREVLNAILDKLKPTPQSLESLLKGHAPGEQAQMVRGLLFLCKYGLASFKQPGNKL